MVNNFKVKTMLRWIRLLCGSRGRARDEDDSEGSGGPIVLAEKNYEIGEMIGQGRLGMVYKCIHKTTQQEFACKKMPVTKNAYDEMLLLENHLSGKHPGILKVKACYWVERLGQYNWSKNVYMISQFCDGGDLQRFLDRNGILSEREAATIMKCIMEALRYCHSQNIIHRDVKPSSIFILNNANSSSSFVVKLGNFDRSIRLTERIVVVKENVGALGYSAPEMLTGNGYSYKVDIWSAGVVLFVLLCGRTPFLAEEDAMMMYEQIQNTEIDVYSGEWSSISDSAKELVLGMLEKDMEQRLSCDEILSNPWILSNAEMDVGSSSTINTEIASTSGGGARHR